MMRMIETPAVSSPYPAHRLWIIVAVLIGALFVGSVLVGPGALLLVPMTCARVYADCSGVRVAEFRIFSYWASSYAHAVTLIAGMALALPVVAHLLIGWLTAARPRAGRWRAHLIGPCLAAALVIGSLVGLAWIAPIRLQIIIFRLSTRAGWGEIRFDTVLYEVLLTTAWTALLAQLLVLVVILVAFGLVTWRRWRGWWRPALVGSVVIAILGTPSWDRVVTFTYALIVFVIYLIGLGLARVVAGLPRPATTNP
jgi:Sec-independent protein secretion pathway component TatC